MEGKRTVSLNEEREVINRMKENPLLARRFDKSKKKEKKE